MVDVCLRVMPMGLLLSRTWYEGTQFLRKAIAAVENGNPSPKQQDAYDRWLAGSANARAMAYFGRALIEAEAGKATPKQLELVGPLLVDGGIEEFVVARAAVDAGDATAD